MEQIKYIGGIVGAFLGGMLGGVDGFLYSLMVLMVVDYISGLMVAYNTKTLSSKIGAKGINKKVHILLLVLVGNIIDTNIIGSGSTFRTAIIFFYIVNECISITENSAKLGLPIPKKLRNILKQLEDELDEETNKDDDLINNLVSKK